MGIFGAMTTAVTGLSSQAYALENISGNIANSQTTGYKRTDSSFADMVGDGIPIRQVAGSVASYSRSTNNLQGAVQSSTASTHMAINGDGFFAVEQKVGLSDGMPIFSGSELYTRRGDFTLDKNGYLVNGAGYYLKGLSINTTTGTVASSVAEVVKLNSNFMPATPTTRVNYSGNLPNEPHPTNYDSTTPALAASTQLLSSSVMTAGVANSTITSSQEPAFLGSTVDGGAVTCYDSQGSSINVQTRWGKTGTNNWSMYYYTQNSASPWAKVGDFTFDSAGALSTPSSMVANVPSLTVNGKALGSVDFNFSGGLTQTYSANHAATTALNQNGNAVGRNATFSIDSDGRVNALFDNGRSMPLAQIPLATFTGVNNLKKMDGGAFVATQESGPPIMNGGGTITGQSLENSNVDVSEEFTRLIVTQQAYSANTRIVTTANSMLQDTINMIR